MADIGELYATVWGGLLDHAPNLGTAIYEYLWLLLRITEEVKDREDSTKMLGIVLGGKPISFTTIAREIKGRTVATTSRNLKRLDSMGWIVMESTRNGLPYKFTVKKSKKWHRPQQELPPEQPPASEDRAAEAVREVFGYYLDKIGRDASAYEFTRTRQQKGVARFRECLKKAQGDAGGAVVLMKAAVDGLSRSAWHMGKEPKTNGKRFVEWEKHLFGSFEQMEKWWNA